MAVPGNKGSPKFSSTLSRGSGEDFDVYCQPCDRDDVRVLATCYCVDCEEHLCDSCLNHHKKAKPSRHHKLLGKDNMPSIQKPSTTSVPLGQSLTKPCPKHSQEFIKLYCHNHKALLCNICVTLQHTGTSCHVDYIPDVSGQIVDSKEYTDALKAMDALSEKCQKITTDLKERVAKSKGSLAYVMVEIKKFRKEINKKLDILEKEAEDAAKAILQENDSKVTAAEIICGDVTKPLKASADSMNLLNMSKQADSLFMELQSAQNLLKDNEKYISQLASSEVKEYQFEPNQAIGSIFEKEKSIGTITEKMMKLSSSTSTTDLESWKPTHHAEIYVKTPEDKEKCYITGMVLLNPSKLILVDENNKSVKMLDINKKSVINQLALDYPCSVTSIASDQVAVTLPYCQRIQFISVSSHKLKVEHTLKVSRECFGICHYKGKLLVSCQGHLKILDMKGTELTTFQTNPGSRVNVTANSDFIFITNSSKGAVFMYNWQGDLIRNHEVMGAPADIAMLDDGSFLVSDFHQGRCNIKHISGDYTNSKVVLKNMSSQPYAICWCAENSSLYVSYFMFSKDEKYINSINIFKML